MVVVIMCFVFLMGIGVGYIICDTKTVKRINEVKESFRKLNKMSNEEVIPKEEDKLDMTAEVDFNKLNIFSVERARNGDTIIGYWKEKVVNGILMKSTGEWHLPIDNEQHLRLINKLRDQIKETESNIEKCK